MHFWLTDVPASGADNDVNRGDTDASCSGGLCLQAHRIVCQSSLCFLSTLIVADFGFSTQELAGDIIPKTNPTTAALTRFKRMEVAMHTVRDQHPKLHMSHQFSCIDISAEGLRPDKPCEVSLELDLERGVEKEK